MNDVIFFYIIITVAFLQPLMLLVTGHINKRQYFGIVQLYMLVLLVAYMADKL